MPTISPSNPQTNRLPKITPIQFGCPLSAPASCRERTSELDRCYFRQCVRAADLKDWYGHIRYSIWNIMKCSAVFAYSGSGRAFNPYTKKEKRTTRHNNSLKLIKSRRSSTMTIATKNYFYRSTYLERCHPRFGYYLIGEKNKKRLRTQQSMHIIFLFRCFCHCLYCHAGRLSDSVHAAAAAANSTISRATGGLTLLAAALVTGNLLVIGGGIAVASTASAAFLRGDEIKGGFKLASCHDPQILREGGAYYMFGSRIW